MRVRKQHITIETGHPCCDGVTVERRRHLDRENLLRRIGGGLRVHHFLLVLAVASIVALPMTVEELGEAEITWMAIVAIGTVLCWAGTRIGSLFGAVSYIGFAGALIWHATEYGSPLHAPEALLLTGLLAIAQMLFTRGMEPLIGFGYGVLLFIGTFSAGSMGDAIPLPVAVAVVSAFVAAAWAVASLIRRERETRDRYRNLVRTAPIAMLDFDLSGLAELIESLRGQRIDRLCEHILSDRGVIEEAVRRSRVRSANQAASELFEVSGNGSRNLHDLVGSQNPMIVPLVQQTMVAIWDGLPSLETELTAETAMGRRMHILCAVSLPAGGAKALRHAPASAVDLTGQKLLEEDLHAQLADRDRFVASISHELRTPLTSVLGLGQSLLDQPAMPYVEMADILRIMVREGQDLAFIIEDLLVGARLELGPLDIVSQAVEAGDEVDRLLASLEVNVVERRIDDELVLIGNKVRFRQILRNMLTNAQKYGGPQIRVVTGRAPGIGYVDIRDNGDPIPEENRQRMFEPYQRLHRQKGTTDSVGLGLAVSRSLARAMGGELEYVHDGVEGIFRVTLPAMAPATPVVPVQGAMVAGQ